MTEIAQKEVSAEEVKAKADRLKAEKERAMVLADVVKHWNGLIRGLIQAKVCWERYAQARLDNAVQLEEFPLELQKMFMLANPHGDFTLIMEDIITHPALDEHLKTLIIKVK